MKKFFLYFLSVVFIAFLALYIWIEKASYIPPLEFNEPILETSHILKSKIRFSILDTGYSEVPAAFAFEGGAYFKRLPLKHHVVVVDHPKGAFLFDSGLGSKIEKQFERLPFWQSWIVRYTSSKPAIEYLKEDPKLLKKIGSIFLSHIHWDHTSGVSDFQNLKIKLPFAEHDWYKKSGNLPSSGILAQHFLPTNLVWEMIHFSPKPYEGFDESLDLFKDGSVVFISLTGHTPGSMGMFINFSPDKRFFFVGDAAWKLDQKGMPLYKGKLGRIFSDQHIPKSAYQILRLQKIKAANPHIQLIPAHDPDAYKTLEHWPNWNKPGD